MKKITLFLFAAMAMMMGNNLNAQISHGGEPFFNNGMSRMKSTPIEMERLDNDRYILEDMDQAKGAGPMRVGIVQHCEIDVVKSARHITDANGEHYVLSVSSPEATFVSLNFGQYELAEGAELFIYNQEGDVVLGSFNAGDAKDDGTFYTQAIPGSSAYIEYNVPAGVNPGRLVVTSMVHGYKDIFRSISGIYDDMAESMKGRLGNAEGDCHFDVVCSEGDDWRQQIRSVVAINILGNWGSYMCTGALINNTRQDRTPYVLSAYHCQDLEDDELRGFTFYFLYETRTCGGSRNSPTLISKSITGADIRAKYSYSSGSDMLLLQLRDTVPFSYKPFFAGWDRNAVSNPAPGACIHHPGGDVKKISIPKRINVDYYYSKFYEVHWYTGSENKGVTEQGSSGSPLFNADKRIIGQLWAGTSYCDQPEGTDDYGRVSVSWNGNNTTSGRLSVWLDPDNTGVYTLDGLDYETTPVGIEAADGQRVNSLTVYPNPSNGNIRFDIDAMGDANYKLYDVNGRCVKEGRTVLTATQQALNLGSLPGGVYNLQLFTSSRNYTATVVIK